MKIGILGGTFNPPHIGHLVLAQEVKEKIGLDRVLFIPTNVPPHKENKGTSSLDRLKMVTLAIQGNKNFKVLDLEIERGGISYTVDTVRELKNKYPKIKFYLIVGSDLANDFPTWKYFRELKESIKIVVAERKDYPLKHINNFILVDITQIHISSSQIRELVHQGGSIKYLVRDNVANYIKKRKLYI
jgi:nicotinate-nucleotide adenylyltransferase